MTSLFDKAGRILSEIQKRDAEEIHRKIGGLYLYAIVSGLLEDAERTGHRILSEFTRRLFGRAYEEDDEAYLQAEEEELFDIALGIIRQLVEFGSLEGEVYLCLHYVLQDGHTHDHFHRNTCSKYYWTRTVDYIGRVYDGLRRKDFL